uniref:hypothetical protein n=1 Tax=Castellaniella defragrans TaxID=75697 RepID=UPI00333FB63B
MTLQVELDRLKTTMQGARQLNVAWDRFCDLSSAPGFIAGSRQSYHEHLPPVVDAVCKIMAADPEGDFQLPAIMQYADSSLYHGAICGMGRVGSFLYFQDLRMGMVALIAGFSRKTDFCRFGLAMAGGLRHFVAPLPQRPMLH